MSAVTHPMDEIPVRQLRFDFGDASQHHPVWSQSCPEFSMFINALGVHVPYFERFLVAVMREYRDEVNNQQLLEDIKRIIGQESHHAFNFVKWNEQLAKRYPEVASLANEAERYFKQAQDKDKNKDKRFKVGFTAGYETFTFLAGLIILDRYEELMGEADPVLRALWVWHQVEEVEHGAVAFDFYQALFGEDEWYRKWMVLRALTHIIKETYRAYRPMMSKEGYHRSISSAWRGWRFFVGFAFDFLRSALPVFKRGYHPRNHPICNDQQNRIAIAWREYYQSGGNGEILSDEVMQVLSR